MPKTEIFDRCGDAITIELLGNVISFYCDPDVCLSAKSVDELIETLQEYRGRMEVK